MLTEQVLREHGARILQAILARSVIEGACHIMPTGGPGKYPQITIKLDESVYFMATAHRAIWMIHHGKRISDQMVVMHTCDEKRCVNIAHLQLGTPADNMADKVRKDRQTKGSAFAHAKLDESKVRALRNAHAAGVSMPDLAEEYGVTVNAISYAINRRTWKHVP